MTIAAILLILAVLLLGAGILIKGLLWLLIVGTVFLIVAVIIGIHSRMHTTTHHQKTSPDDLR
jgi:fatty acid desaturase